MRKSIDELPGREFFPKRGPQTPEARRRCSEASKESWDADRRNRLKGMNANRAKITRNLFKILRLKLRNPQTGGTLSQGDFAEILGLSRSRNTSVSNWENGEYPPRYLVDRMVLLAQSQGVDWVAPPPPTPESEPVEKKPREAQKSRGPRAKSLSTTIGQKLKNRALTRGLEAEQVEKMTATDLLQRLSSPVSKEN